MIRVGDQAPAWQPGPTLAQVMDTLEDGHLHAVVRLNGKLVSRPDCPNTAVPCLKDAARCLYIISFQSVEPLA